MAGTFAQLHVQVVFAVYQRQKLIHPSWQEELNKYISGIIKNKGQKPIIVNGLPDHIHVFFGMKPNCCVSDLTRDIKNNSSNFINDYKLPNRKFAWQSGFGAFSYSASEIDQVYKYIQNQQLHHQKASFREEYVELLNQHRVEFEERYLFN
ncbi:MAG: IS200/IS605 family transposase [Cyclobacteriaceae bacterium]|nr:IS200/IS605 family transposase [Cyclobacteriaceae bacterium]HQQ83881.1 IS200/IS605 family transposase [Cyclobacteriaceae bacterium]